LTRDGGNLRIDVDEGGVRIWIHVTPRARRAGKHGSVGGLHGDALCVAVAAPAVEGRANAACTRALASALDLPSSAIVLDPAARGRRKRVQLAGPPGTLAGRLRALAANGGVG